MNDFVILESLNRSKDMSNEYTDYKNDYKRDNNISFEDFIDSVITQNTALEPHQRVNLREYILSNPVMYEVYFTAYNRHIGETA